MPFIIYADLECIIEKIDGCKDNPKNSSETQVTEHIPSSFSMSTISSFKSIENKHDVCRGKDCIKKFCESLTEHEKHKESYENSNHCYICKENLENKYVKDKKYCKVRDHCHCTGEYRGAVDSICNLKYSVTKNSFFL